MVTKNIKLGVTRYAQKEKTTNIMEETNPKRYGEKIIEGGRLDGDNPVKYTRYIHKALCHNSWTEHKKI